MSRYLILVLLNIPLIAAGIVNSYATYKIKTISRRQMVLRTVMWLIILVSLCLVKPTYDLLFSSNLTRTEPLSLFDVIQITGIVFAILISVRAYSKADLLERQLHDLHQQVAITLSTSAHRPRDRKVTARKIKR